MLSREFLLDRGYCCGHGCLMCPYEPKHIKGNTMKNEDRLAKLDARIANLEQTIKEFMDKWGPDVQRQRDERDEKWDEMVRILSIQKKNNKGT